MKENRDTTTRPIFPKRAVITAGMPYGNKELHFGHIGGVFVHADTFARFLRDRIGEDNVIFVSGTDCYGSPILESYRKLVEAREFCKTKNIAIVREDDEAKEDDGIRENDEIREDAKDSKEEGEVWTIEDYVRKNHILQKETLDKYEISLNLYGASALDRPGAIHNKVSKELFERLYENGSLTRLSTPQFYDPEFEVFLNGRQVEGQCPIDGCASDKAYADECALGHQYMPTELIRPKSVLSGKKPELRNVENWYFKLDEYNDMLTNQNEYLKDSTTTRKYIIKTVDEFLKPPYIYVKKSLLEGRMNEIKSELPKHSLISEDNKSSITFVFDTLEDRDIAREIFAKRDIYFRTGKTLVPFRLSGNIDWGVKVPDKEGVKDLTFWVWPESLWAPISFTRAYLESIGKEEHEWTKWWNDKDSMVYQFIGEDNIYFYGIAEMAMFYELAKKKDAVESTWEGLTLPHLIANRHILFMDKKASSSNKIKPPMAKDLLAFYTPEQLRIHFLSLGLSTKSVSFQPQVYMPEQDRKGADIVLKEGNLLTNVFNRLVRSCFYTAQSYYNSKIPVGSISEAIVKESEEAVLEYERHMYHHEFHSITYVLDTYIRNMNKYWVNSMRTAESTNDADLRCQVLIDSFHVVKTTATLLHPIAPTGCEMIKEYLGVDKRIWDWDYIFKPIYDMIGDNTNHKLKFLEPRIDFFEKHKSQFKN